MKTPGPVAMVTLLGLGAPGLLLSSCSDESAPALDLRVEELVSPADGWSAQPFLAATDSGAALSWLETRADARGRETTLWMNHWTPAGWTARRAVARGADLLVNWADFPSILPLENDALAAHWLVRGGGRGEDYGIHVAASRNGGRIWTDPWIPHDDRSATAHGFASLFRLDQDPRRDRDSRSQDSRGEQAFGLVWLDGRGQAGDPEGDVSLWFRETSFAGAPSGATAPPEVLLDGRVCECCKTDVVVAAEGPVVAYRDRSPGEVRDIRVIRRVAGRWEEPRLVHEDGWVFPACPINGPAIDADGRRVAVAWFTAADDTPRVHLAFSGDAGASYASPIRVDEGSPAGRVDVVLMADGSALVSWLERLEGGAEIRLRRVARTGGRSPAHSIAETGGGQATGFPQMVPGPEGDVLVAWTDARDGESRIRLARAWPGGPS